MELIAGVVGAVVGLLVLILLFIAVVAPWILIVKYKRRRSLDTFVLEELAKHRPHTDSSEFLGNDYVRSKLFQGQLCSSYHRVRLMCANVCVLRQGAERHHQAGVHGLAHF